LNTMWSMLSWLKQPLARLVRCRIVAKALSIGFDSTALETHKI